MTKRRHAHAFTLIELLVTIALLAVLMMLAAPSFKEFQRNSQLSSQVNTLVATFYSAKNEAIKRNRTSFIVPIDGRDWASGWLVFVDNNMNDSYDADIDTKVIEINHIPENLIFSANGTAADTTGPYVSFNSSGYPRDKSNGNTVLSFSVKVHGLQGNEELRNTRYILLSIAGRIRSCRPNSSDDKDCKRTLSD